MLTLTIQRDSDEGPVTDVATGNLFDVAVAYAVAKANDPSAIVTLAVSDRPGVQLSLD